MDLKEKRAELIQELRQAKTAAEEDRIKLEIDKIEELMAVHNSLDNNP